MKEQQAIELPTLTSLQKPSRSQEKKTTWFCRCTSAKAKNSFGVSSKLRRLTKTSLNHCSGDHSHHATGEETWTFPYRTVQQRLFLVGNKGQKSWLGQPEILFQLQKNLFIDNRLCQTMIVNNNRCLFHSTLTPFLLLYTNTKCTSKPACPFSRTRKGELKTLQNLLQFIPTPLTKMCNWCSRSLSDNVFSC